MKQLELYFRAFCMLLSMLLPVNAARATDYPATASQVAENPASRMDSVEIGLITCTPHEEVYSLYGHTAIRYHELRKGGQDVVFNYGVFNFKAPHFVTRFVLGKTDYELGIVPTKPFCKYYRDWGSMVTEQVLNLTNEEKERITRALALNLRPENRIYRYNFFYDNCSTRPRDIIENNLTGRIVYEPRKDYQPSYREMVHELTSHHPWASLGNDLLLGVKADLPTTRRQQEFLPLNLMHDFDHAQINDGADFRPLVKERRMLVSPGVQLIEQEFPLTPTACAILLLAACIGILLIELRKKRSYVWVDAILMLCSGIAGTLIFIMFFSEHPTTSTNLQILLLNPLPLLFLFPVLRRRPTTYWKISLILTILFFIGGIWQDYAEGMEILAFCLLTRNVSHFKNDK